MTSAITWSDPERHQSFEDWLAPVASRHGLDPAGLRPASSDASFRRYFRLDRVAAQAADASGAGSLIVMDAPPSHEDCRPFVKIARLLRDAGLQAPEVIEWDEARGFMLLSDLGGATFLSRLDPSAPMASSNRSLYRGAIDALIRLQGIPAQGQVPDYDEPLLRRELDLFPQWYLQRHLGMQLDERQQADLERVFRAVLDNNLAQPRVLVHRDYHSRNLMAGPPGAGQDVPGILDFQDAVYGPITYDLVSLLRDAYVEWDEEVQIDYCAIYWERARKAGLPVAADFADFWRDFEWMGVQRQLKVLGIFARLAHRDGKHGYLNDIPRVWGYVHRAAVRYRDLAPLARLLEAAAGVPRESGYTF